MALIRKKFNSFSKDGKLDYLNEFLSAELGGLGANGRCEWVQKVYLLRELIKIEVGILQTVSTKDGEIGGLTVRAREVEGNKTLDLVGVYFKEGAIEGEALRQSIDRQIRRFARKYRKPKEKKRESSCEY